MDRIRSGFHRKSRKESPSRPTIVTDAAALQNNRSSGATTPEPGAQHSPLQIPPMSSKKTSPFRTLRDLSRSHKRARSPASGSEPANSPTSAPTSAFGVGPRDSPSDKMVVSPHPLSAFSRHGDNNTTTRQREDERLPKSPQPERQQQQQQQDNSKIPSFLTLSAQEIDARFQEILWLERVRMSQGTVNPSLDFRWARVAGPHLRKLDRYINIQPWHNNRVRLRVPQGKQDYINASPITLYPLSTGLLRQQGPNVGEINDKNNAHNSSAEPDRYIAMQGPKHKTTDHVWRMVVEQLNSPAVMVMLTETHEAGMEKCYPYFPRSPSDEPLEVGRKNEFGDGFRASVRCETVEETEAGDAIELRKLVIRVYKGPRKGDAGHIATSAESKQPVEAAVTAAAAASVDENGDVNMLSPEVRPVELEEVTTVDHDNESASTSMEVSRPFTEGQQSQGTPVTLLPTKPAAPATRENHEPTAEEERQQQQQQQPPPLPPPQPQPEEDYEERVVWHFLYKKWPDFGVPALEDLDSFFTLMRLSREKNASPSNPRIIHCSAGVGRTGTFIALEYLMRELNAGVLEDWDAVGSRALARKSASSGACAGTGGDVDVHDAVSTEGYSGHGVMDPSLTAPTPPPPPPPSSSTSPIADNNTAAANVNADDDDAANKMDVEEGGAQQQPQPPSSITDDTCEACESALYDREDLIFNTVNRLREQRRHMVQADAQYLFIYRVLRKLWEDKYGPGAGAGAGAGAGSAAAGTGNSTATPSTNTSSKNNKSSQRQQRPHPRGVNGEPAAKRFEFDPFVEAEEQED